jgi:hypothetical protein
LPEPLSREERDALLARLSALDRELYPPEGEEEPSRRQRALLEETYYRVLAEYSDRLPRVPMSACPFTAARLVRAIDPYGLDGPFWHKVRTFTPEEPAAPPTFKVLLGGLDLRGREPSEAEEEVIAGPDVPYVVPRLLELPGMVAVVTRIELRNGDLAYPIAYFSREPIPPGALHQPWLRQELWFTDENGRSAWLSSNAPWDFDLASWIERSKLGWIEPGDETFRVRGSEDLGRCPFLDLAGDRRPQTFASGTREQGEPPSGVPFAPFEEP